MTASAWTDRDWVGIRLDDTVIYGLHIETFTPAGTFAAATAQLPRLCTLGITTLEVMSVATLPGDRNGVEGLFPFSVKESYGGTEGLARFVDAAHEVGLAVVLEIDCSHSGTEGSAQRVFIERAVAWRRDHHLDGLHLDGLHLDDAHLNAPFVRDLTGAVHAEAERSGRNVLVTIGPSANDPSVVQSAADDGWGCDAIWDDDMQHALLGALTSARHEYADSHHRNVARLAAAWEHRWVQHTPTFDIARRQVIIFGTDRVGHSGGHARLLADLDAFDPRHRLAAAALLLSPFTPLLFMGEEYGERAAFPDETLDPTVTEGEPHRSRLALYTELLRLRRHHSVLTASEVPQEVSTADAVMTVTRWGPHATVTICFNFSDEPVGREAEGEVVFDTDDHSWGGPGRRRDIVGPWSARLELAP